MIKNVIIIILLLSNIVLAGGTKIYIPRKVEGQIITRDREISQKPEPLRSMVSRQNLLGLDRDTPFSLPKSKNGLPMTLATQQYDTLHILAIKIEFEIEEPEDNPTTTGNGNFDLRDTLTFFQEEGHKIDRAPHNTSYFAAHLRALNRYWSFVSDYHVHLTWDIYPQQEDSSLQLPHPMAYYGSEGPWADSGVVMQLGTFFRHAIALADTSMPEIDFSQYQSIILFHAGSDQQNNLSFVEDTPNDFWTGFLWTDSTIFVDDSTWGINEGLIMPETNTQDNRIGVLNATLAHEFGHQLGLVDLYNTSNFLTTVGDFSLMDNNGQSIVVELGDEDYTAIVSSVMPIFPDAWSRAYLGFSGVTEVIQGENIEITAAEQLHHNNEVVKVPITEWEYFLLENRQEKSDFSYLQYPTDDTIPFAIQADSITGVILGPVCGYYDLAGTPHVDSCNGYDCLIPGSGLLIWHVDETVAYMNYTGYGDNFLMNTLQWDPDRRFVKLVEADGVEDFGGNYVSWGYYGIDEDIFKAGNNTALTPSTHPDSRSNLGANTHISITDISATDTIMTCNIATGWHQAGFPIMSFPDLGNGEGGLLTVDIDSDGSPEIINARGKFIMAANPDGSPVMDTIGLSIDNFDDDTLVYIWPRFAQLDTNIAGNIIAGDFDGDDSLEIACFDIANKLYFYEGYDLSPDDNFADLMASISLTDSVTAGPVAFDYFKGGIDGVIAGFADSTISLITFIDSDSFEVFELVALDGVPLKIAVSDTMLFAVFEESGSLSLFVGEQDNESVLVSEQNTVLLPDSELEGLVCGDINRDDTDDAVITVGDYLCIYDGDSRSLKVIDIENPGPPALGDINSDGYPDIVLAAGDTYLAVYAFSYKGVLFDGFPVRVTDGAYTISHINQPLLTDLNSDNNPDIVVVLPYTDVTCINNHGDKLGGFPLATSTEITTEPIVGDLDGDGDLEIAVIDYAGFISAWDVDGSDNVIDQPWPTSGGDISRRGYLAKDYEKTISLAAGFFPEGSVYNYPNPASNSTTFRYYIDRPADIDIRIYDMSGELVDRLTHSAVGGTGPDEVVWDCSDFASGVYFARIEASAQDMSRHENILIKVALIK